MRYDILDETIYECKELVCSLHSFFYCQGGYLGVENHGYTIKIDENMCLGGDLWCLGGDSYSCTCLVSRRAWRI